MQDFTIYKILNGIKYFVSNTRHVGRTKLFKLLFFWDFLHFKEYGLSITGYQYYTFPFGPVPVELYDQIINNNLPPALQSELKIIQDDEDEYKYKTFRVALKNKQIDYDWLTPNEIKILERVVLLFRDLTARDMTEITHLPNSPYDKTLKDFGMNKPIDYRLAIDKDSPLDQETVEEYIALQKEIYHHGRFQ
ncbi:MAG: SocA family protein [Candidatus Marinimicrobia bacterium]|nr:SocA family protein [bacterium]MCG2717127.1 SocA family protein [Candidatus Neomarinimicrobiota bacterium]